MVGRLILVAVVVFIAIILIISDDDRDDVLVKFSASLRCWNDRDAQSVKRHRIIG